MEKERYINEFAKMIGEIDRFIKLIEKSPDSKNIFNKNLEMLKEIVESEYEMITDGVSNGDTNLEYILSPTKQFLSAADKSDYGKMLENYQTLFKYKQEIDKQEKNRGNKIIDIFQIDLKEMKIHQAKLEALQELVQIDIKMYGGVSQITLEVLDVQNCELIDNHVVWEKGVYDNVPGRESMKEQEDTTPVPEDRKDMDGLDMQQQSEDSGRTKQSYKANVYMKNAGNKNQPPKIIYGNSLDELLATLQGWNKGRTEDMQFSTCYVSKLNPDTRQYENSVKYDVATGADITPVYLSLPHMERSEFLKTIDQLKKDGARYNPVEKRFFVTKQMDLNKFSVYLPKDSISSKLNQNKARTGTGREAAEPVRTEKDYSR